MTDLAYFERGDGDYSRALIRLLKAKLPSASIAGIQSQINHRLTEDKRVKDSLVRRMVSDKSYRVPDALINPISLIITDDIQGEADILSSLILRKRTEESLKHLIPSPSGEHKPEFERKLKILRDIVKSEIPKLALLTDKGKLFYIKRVKKPDGKKYYSCRSEGDKRDFPISEETALIEHIKNKGRTRCNAKGLGDRQLGLGSRPKPKGRDWGKCIKLVIVNDYDEIKSVIIELKY